MIEDPIIRDWAMDQGYVFGDAPAKRNEKTA